jgi:flagellar biosynthetic protein FliS
MTRANAYKNVQATTASKERLMALLFEAALRHIRHGRSALEKKDRTAFFTAMEKASAIVIELQCTLKPEVAPELCEQLKDIYGFVVGRLLQAATTGNPTFITDAERAFAPVADAFIQAAAQVAAAPVAAQAAR